MAHIIYEDDEIRAIWHAGDTDFLLVTFGDLVSRIDEVKFFADGPVIKSRLSCLGVMPKRSTWYPPESMRRLRARVADDIAPYRTRINYGGSMGGYAAIKFSALMGATHVLSLCPQWSIDPSEVDRRYLPWGDYFTPDMAGMAVRTADISGRIVVFADPRFAVDEFHRQAIRREWPEMIAIDVNSSDHHVTSIFAGTQNLNDLIFAARFLPPGGILSVANLLRRRSVHRAEVVMRRAMTRFPRSVGRILIARARKDASYRSLRLNFYVDVLRALLHSKERGLALRFVATFFSQFSRRGSLRVFNTLHGRLSGSLRRSAQSLSRSSSSLPG